MSEASCPRCHIEVRPNQKFCVSCGLRQPPRCPNCRQPLRQPVDGVTGCAICQAEGEFDRLGIVPFPDIARVGGHNLTLAETSAPRMIEYGGARELPGMIQQRVDHDFGNFKGGGTLGNGRISFYATAAPLEEVLEFFRVQYEVISIRRDLSYRLEMPEDTHLRVYVEQRSEFNRRVATGARLEPSDRTLVTITEFDPPTA